MWDPFMTPPHLEKYLYYLWLAQLLNLYGMALVKLSVCAYIFMLDFSRTFRILIWISIVIHISINFIFPTVVLFGECTPYSKHWDVTGTKPGSCWGSEPRVISGYSGAAVNIATDLLYTMAPLVYISRIQLAKRTIWGVRAVFLCGLVYVFRFQSHFLCFANRLQNNNNLCTEAIPDEGIGKYKRPELRIRQSQHLRLG
jgi:hypothetical protein